MTVSGRSAIVISRQNACQLRTPYPRFFGGFTSFTLVLFVPMNWGIHKSTKPDFRANIWPLSIVELPSRAHRVANESRVHHELHGKFSFRSRVAANVQPLRGSISLNARTTSVSLAAVSKQTFRFEMPSQKECGGGTTEEP
jgi:hypothetical protein